MARAGFRWGLACGGRGWMRVGWLFVLGGLAAGFHQDWAQAAGGQERKAVAPGQPGAGQPGAAVHPQAEKKKDGGKPQHQGATRPPLPSRPQRLVVAPTLTSAEVDRLVLDYLRKNDPKVEPAPLTSDVEFVRRIYFDLIGKPPTPEQVQYFVRDRSKDKRALLIDVLLGTPEYARNWARYWRDVIKARASVDNVARIRTDMLEDWLEQAFAHNKPWDEIAAGLITATGRNDENGAVGFALAHDALPVEIAGEVSRIFMGVQIQCAQCHDHKTDSWKRRQFHEFAAFFAGVRQRQVVKPEPGQLPVFALQPQAGGRYFMPELQDPKKLIPVAPRFFLANGPAAPPAIPETASPLERRTLAASYVTGQDNPWFARAYVNRIWYVLMGEAFYEPIDDMGPERTAKAPEVLNTIADQWQKGGYDVRWLFRLITNTQAYQRRVRSTYNEAGKTQFASSCPSRMRSDQIFDELAYALDLPLDARGDFVRPANGNRPAAAGAVKPPGNASPPPARPPLPTGKQARKAVAKAGFATIAAKNPKLAARIGGPRALFNRLFELDPSLGNDEITGTIPQALYLMNGTLVNNRVQARPGTILGQILSSTSDDRAALGALYLRVLSRQPTSREVEICGRYLQAVGDRREAFEDIFWSLINTTEFLTRR